MQIKISIPDKIYKQLKSDAEKNFRTLGAEVSFIVSQYFISQSQSYAHMNDSPGSPDTPSNTPTTSTTSNSNSNDINLLLKEKIKEVQNELPKPAKAVRFTRPDGEPFTLEDFESFLNTKNNETYHTLRKHIPSLQLTTILREGATRTTDDFINLLKEDYIVTIYSALDIPMNHNLSESEWQEIAGYLTPILPD